jgi:phosphoribosylformylglycinamidine cyclo-ligase
MPPVFEWLRRMGPVEQRDVDRTWNQGLGLILAVPAAGAEQALRFLRRRGERAYAIGEVVRGSAGVDFVD